MSVTMDDKSFVVDWNKSSDSAYTAIQDESKLWHKRYCWIYFLQHKYEVALVFWKFKAGIETKTCCKLKTLKSDNGIEYTSASCIEEAKAHQGWKQTVADEISMIEKNQTWQLVERPANRKVIGVKWVFRAKIDGYLASLGFERNISEPTLHVKKQGSETQLIVSLYVDDMLVTGGDHEMLADFKAKMEQMFEISDLVQMSYFLGMEATSTPVAVGEKLSSQGDFEQVSEFVYRSLVGCLLYLTATRPDIIYVVRLLSRFMHCYNEKHFQAAKRVLRYIKGTLSYGVLFSKAESMKLVGYADSDWARSIDDMKSTSGYVLTLGSAIFCWNLRKQNVVAQSTAEVEYVAAARAVNQAIWLRKIMADLNLHQREAIEINCDNQSTIAIAKNLVFHGRTKHFKIKFHFVREMEQAQEVKLIHCSFGEQLVDILTKPP
ncbi:receptor-like protein 12 [Gossypium australe]|uniref:Receptor-like protein 12 n=1 Tax=Gossypium australe TaxID=47621 RepID=A0A5B6W0N8_9ROSI|nr:receptor-like protein 12 [Gossypium australe]